MVQIYRNVRLWVSPKSYQTIHQKMLYFTIFPREGNHTRPKVQCIGKSFDANCPKIYLELYTMMHKHNNHPKWNIGWQMHIHMLATAQRVYNFYLTSLNFVVVLHPTRSSVKAHKTSLNVNDERIISTEYSDVEKSRSQARNTPSLPPCHVVRPSQLKE